MKVCSKCKIEKNESEFPQKKESRDGLRSYCKRCKRNQDLIYRIVNKEKVSRIKKEYYENNKTNISRNKKVKYYQTPINERNVARKEWVKNNPEKYRAYQKAYQPKYHQVNREKINTQARKRDGLRKDKGEPRYSKKWAVNNRERLAQLSRKAAQELRQWYVRNKLKRQGWTNEMIEQDPYLLNVKKAIITYKRIKNEKRKECRSNVRKAI